MQLFLRSAEAAAGEVQCPGVGQVLRLERFSSGRRVRACFMTMLRSQQRCDCGITFFVDGVDTGTQVDTDGCKRIQVVTWAPDAVQDADIVVRISAYIPHHGSREAGADAAEHCSDSKCTLLSAVAASACPLMCSLKHLQAPADAEAMCFAPTGGPGGIAAAAWTRGRQQVLFRSQKGLMCKLTGFVPCCAHATCRIRWPCIQLCSLDSDAQPSSFSTAICVQETRRDGLHHQQPRGQPAGQPSAAAAVAAAAAARGR